MIINRQREVRIAVKPLAMFLRTVKRALRLRNRDFVVCLVSLGEIRRLNRAYRGKDKATDILSFPTDAKRTRSPYLGDIAIAPARARRNARLYGRSLPQELRILILHGVLHLLGYDHETDGGEMNRLEQRLRARFGLV